MATHMPSKVFTQGGSLATYAIDNGTLLTPANNIANVNKTTISVFSIILIVIHLPFFLVAAIGNITVIVVRLKKFVHQRLSAYKQLICHLSVATVLYAAAIPLDIYYRINKKHWIQNTIV